MGLGLQANRKEKGIALRLNGAQHAAPLQRKQREGRARARPYTNRCSKTVERLLVRAGIAAVAFTARRTRVASAASGGFLLLFAGFADESFTGEADLVALHGENFHEDLVAEFQLIANVADAMLGDFADVQEAVGAGEKFDEGAELREANDFP